jgi:hypothetical protein
MFYKLKKVFEAAVVAITTPESFQKGEDFEVLVKSFFSSDVFKLISQTNGFNQNKDVYAEDTLKPDFLYSVKGKNFYVEAKYRSSLTDDGFLLKLPDYQFKRYMIYSKEYPLFLIISLGGNPSNPERIFLVPFKYQNIFPAKKYELFDDFVFDESILNRKY